jgi:ankyrin repeat protein
MRRIKQHATLSTKKGLFMKKIATGLLIMLMTPTLSWGMQRKQLSPKPTKSRLQAAQNRKNRALLQAAQDGNFEQVETLANQAEINFHEPENDASPLLVACEKGHLKIVKFLVQKLTKKELNEPRGLGTVSVTPVWLAAQKKRTACVRALVAAGADVSIPDREGYLPIHLAAEGADLNLLCCLLQANADTANMQNMYGVTPLHKACYHNNIDAAALLLNYGANPELKDVNGLSAFGYALQCADEKMRKLLERHAPTSEPENSDAQPRCEEHPASQQDPALARVAWICMPPEFSATT